MAINLYPKSQLIKKPKIKAMKTKKKIDSKRIIFILFGLLLFLIVYLIPDLPDAVDPYGKHFVLGKQG